MASNPHFLDCPSWSHSVSAMGFEPRIPVDTLGHPLQVLRVFVRDHRMREVAPSERMLEAHYGSFVVSQSRPGAKRARSLAMNTSYGASSVLTQVAGLDAKAWELGPEPIPDDLDGRPPAVITWADGDRFYLIASDQRIVGDLIKVAESLYVGKR